MEDVIQMKKDDLVALVKETVADTVKAKVDEEVKAKVELMKKGEVVTSPISGDAPIAKDLKEIVENPAVVDFNFYKTFKPKYSVKEYEEGASFIRKWMEEKQTKGSFNASFQKTMTSGTTSGSDTGGYTIPTILYSEIIRKQFLNPGLLELCTNLALDEKIEFPQQLSDVFFYYPGENTLSTSSDETFSAVTIDVFEIIGRTNMSRKLFRLSAFNLVDFVTTLFANALVRDKNKRIIAGTGSGQPQGIRGLTYTNTLAQAGASIAVTDIEAMFYTLPIQYRERPGVCWMMADSVHKKVATLKDSYGRPLMFTSYVDGIQYRMMGRPVKITNDIPTNLGAGTNASEIYFGDMSYYLFNNGASMQTETTTTTDTAWKYNLLELKMSGLNGGNYLNTDGMAQMTAVK